LNEHILAMKKDLLFVLIILNPLLSIAQEWQHSYKSDLPIRVSNNAVTHAAVNSILYVYTFGGIDSTKLFSGITQKSFRYNTSNDVWMAIDDLPDTLGKIAMSASTVKNKIYIIGGYHVFANGNEISSNKVHVFDPITNAFLADGQNIPTPIDDQVQCVWRDSLIYVITGWSNNTNVANVQIYNPAINNWTTGTSVPNNNTYKAFGASGTIVGDTIYYYGGASLGNNFPAASALRKGIINSNNPNQITWSNPFTFNGNPGYRTAAASDSLGNIYFIGGSSVSYNYNGNAYNGSGTVNPSNSIIYCNTHSNQWWVNNSQTLPMDLRGIAEVNSFKKYIVGGMQSGAVVSNKTLELSFINTTSIHQKSTLDFKLYPNPSNGIIYCQIDDNEIGEYRVEVFNTLGQVLFSKKLNSAAYANNLMIDLRNTSPGLVLVKLSTARAVYTKNILISSFTY
jgi:hypothetical protein